jgi:DNA-binding beta-propeller fold protein YncE
MIDRRLTLEHVVRVRLPSPRPAAVCGGHGDWPVGARRGVPVVATAIALTLLLCGCGASARPHSSAAVGVLSQLPGTQGCVSEDGSGGCSQARALERAQSIAVSGDGRIVYVTSRSGFGAVAVFRRDAAGGALVQPAGRAGCVIRVVRVSASGCSGARSLLGANSVAITPDGLNAYVTAFHSVAAFRRDRHTGALTQLPGRKGCVTPPRHDGCAHQRALYGTDAIAISPDGRNVYVASGGESGLVVFRRNRRTGTLAPLAGKAACVTAYPFRGCALGRAIIGPESVAVSPDGRNVYVAAAGNNSVASFTRDRATGALTQPAGKAGCVSFYPRRSCVRGPALDSPWSITVSPDGRSVYVASVFGGVVLLRRDPASGALTEPTGAAGCVNSSRALGCASGRALDAARSVVVSADGRSVYATSSGGDRQDAIAVFARNRFDGTLTQLAGAPGCLNADGAHGCTPVRAMHYVLEPIAVSPDDRSAYVIAITSSSYASVVVFARTTAR